MILLGIVIGVAFSHNRTMRLYDARAYERGPFSVWDISTTGAPTATSWTRLAFSNDGNYILISGTRCSIVYFIGRCA